MTLDKHHVVLYLVATALALFGVYLFESKLADKAQSKADAAQATAQLLAQQNQQFQAQMQQQINQLAQALAARQVIEVKIPTANQSLTSSQTADTLSKATNAKPGEVTSVGDTVVMDLPISRTVLSDVQLVPLLQQDKVDLDKQLKDEQAAHASDTKADAAKLDACKATVVAVQKKSLRRAIKAFFIGVVVGVIGARVAGI